MANVKKSFNRTELQKIQSDLVKLRLVCGTAIAYAVMSLDKAVEAELIEVGKRQEMSQTPESEMYREDLQKLYMDSVYKDSEGKPLLNNNKQYQLENPKVFQENTMALLEKYPTVKADIEAHDKEYSKFLQETVTVEYDSLTKKELSTELNATEIELLAEYWSVLTANGLTV